MNDDPLGLRLNTGDPLGLRAERPVANIPERFRDQELRSASPETPSFFGGLYDQLFTGGKAASTARAQNIMALSEQLGMSPSMVNDHYDEIARQQEMADQPAYRDVIERPLMGAVVAGLLTHPLATVVGVTAFGILAEAENYLASKASGKEYQFGAGKGLADMLPEDTAQGFKDLVWTADMAWKAIAAGGAIKATKPAAEQFAMRYMRDVTEKYNLPRNVYISPEKIREFHGLGREDVITPEEAGMLKDMGLSRKDYIDALKYGIDIEIPAEKLVTVVDKPWWATMKEFFRASPYEETIVSGGKATGRKPISGMLEEPATKAADPGPIVPLDSSGEPATIPLMTPQKGTANIPAKETPVAEAEYKGQHRPMTVEAGAGRLHDLEPTFGPDIYGPNAIQYFGTGEKVLDIQTLRILKSVKGKPDAEVIIYRAIPKDAPATVAAPGDWVTVNKKYAQEHGEGILGGNYKIIEQTVKAKDLTTNADSFHEQGYYPETTPKAVGGELIIKEQDRFKQLAYNRGRESAGFEFKNYLKENEYVIKDQKLLINDPDLSIEEIKYIDSNNVNKYAYVRLNRYDVDGINEDSIVSIKRIPQQNIREFFRKAEAEQDVISSRIALERKNNPSELDYWIKKVREEDHINNDALVEEYHGDFVNASKDERWKKIADFPERADAALREYKKSSLPNPSSPPEGGGQSITSGEGSPLAEIPDDTNILLEMAARSDEVAMPPQTTEYDKIRAQAAQIAYTNLSKKLNLKERRERAAIQRQGIEDARLDPIFTAMNEIVAGGGLNRDWLLKTYDKGTVNELAKKRVGLVTKEGNIGLDVYADMLGFPSDDAMMNALLGWTGLKEAGKKAAADFEARAYELLSEAEKEDFHLALLEEEAKILRKMIKATGKPSAPGIKKVIREQTGQTRVEELMVSEYEALKASMKKAEQASREAFRAGNKEGTLAEKERQIEMATARRDKLKAKQEAYAIHDGIIKLTKDKGIPEEYQDRIADLLEGFDLLPRNNKGAARVESAREFLERQKAAGEDITIPESMLARIERYGKIHWRQMTLDQLREVYDQAKIYAHLGKLKNKLLKAKEGRDFESTVERFVSEINKNWGVKGVSPAEAEGMFLEESAYEKLSGFKESYLASLTKVETYLRRLDGFKDLGPLWETVYLPIKQASDVEFRKLAEITKTLQELFAPMRKTLTKEKFKVPGIEQFLTKETVIMAAMNSGNEGNLTALKENKVYGFDDPKIAAILAKVTPEEWALVRGVWDLFEKQYPELAAVYKNLSGVTLKKVEGDYFPLVFDRKLSWIADRNATEKELRDFFQSIYTLPSVKSGSTIERVGGKLPPKLKFTVIFEKLAEINHYITHAEAVRDVQKILGDPRVRAAIESAPTGIGGPEAYREMTSWLQDVARQQSDPLSAVEAAIKTARINTTTVAMAWKFSTAVVQFLGATNSIYKVGAGEFTKALAEFYTHREAMVEKIRGMSAEVAGRSKSFDRELRDAYNRIGLDHFRNSHALKDSFYSLISLMDMAVAYPTWLAAYNKSMKEIPGEDGRAIEYADMILRTTQGAGLVKDLAGIQRGAEMKKILSMFYTYFSAYHQMMGDAWVKYKYGKTGESFADLMKAWWWLTIIPATLDYMIKERDIPSPGKFLENVLQQRLTAYPVVRDITGAVLTDFDYQMTPVARAGEVVGRTVKEAANIIKPDEEMDFDKLLRYGLESSGYIFGLPTGQAVVTMQGIIDLKNGDTTDLSRLLFRAPREED